MKAYVKGLFLGLTVLFLFSALVFVADNEGYFLVNQFDYSIVAEDKFSSSNIAELYKTSSAQILNPLKGASLLSISVKEIKSSLLKQEWIDEVRIRRVFPDSLRIEAKPKKWLAYYIDKGKYYPFTDHGEILSDIPILQGPDLPVIVMSKNKFDLHKNYILNTFHQLPKQGAFSQETLQEIALDERGVYFSIEQGTTWVRLGDEDIDLRIVRANKVLGYLLDHGLQGRVIDADYGQKVVVKLRKAR